MILIITNKKDYTADYLILELKSRSIDFFRLKTEDFPTQVDLILRIDEGGISGYIKTPFRSINVSDISSVWFRRPKESLPSSESVDPEIRQFIIIESRQTLEGLWRVLPAFWVSVPDNIYKAESKIYQLKVAKELGFATPNTLITNSPGTASKFIKANNRTIYKPLKKGRLTSEDAVSYIYTSLIGEAELENIYAVKYAPSLLQPYIQKDLDVRVTVVGNLIFAAEIHSQSLEEAKIDWRRVDMGRLPHFIHNLPVEIEEKCRNLVKKLGLSFGAIDLILTHSGEYIFLEINPNGQWAWIQELCPELQIREALIDLLVSEGGANE